MATPPWPRLHGATRDPEARPPRRGLKTPAEEPPEYVERVLGAAGLAGSYVQQAGLPERAESGIHA
jgi:hypothetical protein